MNNMESLARNSFSTSHEYWEDLSPMSHTIPENSFSLYENVNILITKRLKKEISIYIEPDGDFFLASLPLLPIYGYGDTRNEAKESLLRQIEICYEDLIRDNNFSEDWLRHKKYLVDIIER